MTLHNRSFLINLSLEGHNYPSWDFISDEDWRNVLSNFVFKIADSFAFAGISKKKDLFPNGLSYFADWELDVIELVEADDDIVCKFRLNDNCQNKLLQNGFAIHDFGDLEPSSYYEFDQLDFFKGDRRIACYINHESEIIFFDLNDREVALINNLAPHIQASFVDSAVLKAAFEARIGKST
jgi:hypothetical protein